jgi:hypothetical protein
MMMQTPAGPVITRVGYTKGNARPSVVQVVVPYPPDKAPFFTETMVKEMLADTQQQMAPEFDVTGHMERPIGGGLTMCFFITERPKR